MRQIFNILAIMGSAMFAGAMLTIGVTLGGYWRSLPATDFLDWFSQHSHFVMRTIPLVVVPTLIGLAGSVWLGWSEAAVRTLWLGASVCIAAVLLLTMVWFLPTNAQFVAKSLPLDQVSGKLDAWLMIHNLRITLAVMASVLGIVAVSK